MAGGRSILPFKTVKDCENWLKRVDGFVAWCDTAIGKAFYDYNIKYFTTTEMSADDIHQIGLREVERISKEMEKVKEQVGYKGDLKSFFNDVRSNKN